MQPRLDSGRFGDRDASALEVRVQRTLGQAELHAVPVAVECRDVPSRDELGRDRRKALDLLACEKEGCAHVRGLQEVEDRRGALRVRTVVERQGDAGLRETAGEPG